MFLDLQVDGLLPTTTTPRELIKHLTATYANRSDRRRQMEEIEVEFNGPYDMKQPVEAYFMKLQEARRHGELLGQPFTEEQTVNRALKQFELQYGYDATKAEKKW